MAKLNKLQYTARISDKPVCLHHQRTIYGVSAGEAAHISCRVDAHPPADTFTWSFNTSNGGMDLPKDQYTNQGSASLLTYKPKDQMDYGTVLCLAENLVGRQVVPCVYHVIPAGKNVIIFINFTAPKSERYS